MTSGDAAENATITPLPTVASCPSNGRVIPSIAPRVGLPSYCDRSWVSSRRLLVIRLADGDHPRDRGRHVELHPLVGEGARAAQRGQHRVIELRGAFKVVRADGGVADHGMSFPRGPLPGHYPLRIGWDRDE